MQRSASRGATLFVAISLFFLTGSGGCGHASFDFITDEADMESGGAGGSPPMASGGSWSAPTGGTPSFPAVGGFFPGGGSFGGEGGALCMGPGCPEPRCCQDIDVTCEPFQGFCAYCSGHDECDAGLACDPFTDQCLPACSDSFDCPDQLPLCDVSRGVCTQCSMNLHCALDLSCIKGGFCALCENCR